MSRWTDVVFGAWRCDLDWNETGGRHEGNISLTPCVGVILPARWGIHRGDGQPLMLVPCFPPVPVFIHHPDSVWLSTCWGGYIIIQSHTPRAPLCDVLFSHSSFLFCTHLSHTWMLTIILVHLSPFWKKNRSLNHQNKNGYWNKHCCCYCCSW